MLDDSNPAPLPPNRAPAVMGRPTVMTDEVEQAILDRIANGESVRAICSDPDMPGKATVFRHVLEDPNFRDRYQVARRLHAAVLVDEILDIVDDGTNDWAERTFRDGSTSVSVNPEALQRSRLRAETRFRLAAMFDPQNFSEKKGVDVNLGVQEGNPIGELLAASKRSALPMGLGAVGPVVEGVAVPVPTTDDLDDDPEP